MKTLPSGVTVFNATPHTVRFWCEEWDEPIEVPTDAVISASVEEEVVEALNFVSPTDQQERVELVKTQFAATEEGIRIIEAALAGGAGLIVGSIIAAQAYPDSMVAMTPTPGYERVPPAEKRMNPYKFITFA